MFVHGDANVVPKAPEFFRFFVKDFFDGITGFFTTKHMKNMKVLRPGDVILDRAFAPSVLPLPVCSKRVFVPPAGDCPGCETGFPIVQNLNGRSEKLSSTLIREKMEGELPIDLNRISFILKPLVSALYNSLNTPFIQPDIIPYFLEKARKFYVI
jgi:hypothetical protein